MFLCLSWCRGWLPHRKRAAKEGTAEPPESALRMAMGTFMWEKRGPGWVGSENATTSGKTCKIYEAPTPELV